MTNPEINYLSSESLSCQDNPGASNDLLLQDGLSAASRLGGSKRFSWPVVVLTVLAGLLLAAHFSRHGEDGLAVASLLAPLLLLLRRPWAAQVLSFCLWGGAAVWLHTTWRLVAVRQALGEPWLRLVLILGAVALLTAAAAWRLGRSASRLSAAESPGRTAVSTGACLLAPGLLAAPHLVVQPPVLLAERFRPGWGWLEIFLLAAYAGWLAGRLHDPAGAATWRRRLWLLFSGVFFLQLLLGLAGWTAFLMTGRLHLPVPAMIVGGPVFRGEGLFMPILFLAVVALAGPAWCSHLCYIGAWDAAAARQRPVPEPLPPWRRWLQLGSLAGVVLGAVLLRLGGASATTAAWCGAAFGLGGLLVMAVFSRRRGAMVHCTAYCPMGLVAAWLGRLNPFRVRLGPSCTECGACRAACRYDALDWKDIRRRRPGPSCTLCGDCLDRCRHGALAYHFPGLAPATARGVFLALVVALHTVFLGVGRI